MRGAVVSEPHPPGAGGSEIVIRCCAFFVQGGEVLWEVACVWEWRDGAEGLEEEGAVWG